MKIKIFTGSIYPRAEVMLEGEINAWLQRETVAPPGITGAPISIVSMTAGVSPAVGDGQVQHTSTYFYKELVEGTTGTYQ